MSKVFRDLLLCESSLIRLLPVPVVAAIIEALSTDPNARQSSWWWGKEHCQLVRKRAVELCGRDAGENALAKLRATLVLLVFVIRHASLLSSCALDDPLYPFGAKGARERIYLSGEEVIKLIAMLKAVGWADIAEELEFDLKFQQDVVRINTEGDQRIAEHCHFSEEEQQVIVTCATSVIVRLSKLVKMMGLVAGQVTCNVQFMGLVRKTTDESKHVAIPFVLAQLFSGNAKLIYSADAVQKLSNDIQSNISDRGTVIAGSSNHAADDETIAETIADPAINFEIADKNDGTDANVKSSVLELSLRATEGDLVLQNGASSMKTLSQPVTQQRDEPQQNDFPPQKKSASPIRNSERTAVAAAHAAVHVSTFVNYSDSVSSEEDPQCGAKRAEREGQRQNSPPKFETPRNEDGQQRAYTTPGAGQKKDQDTFTFTADNADGGASSQVQTVYLDGSAHPAELPGDINRKALVQEEAVRCNNPTSFTSTKGYQNRQALSKEKNMQEDPSQFVAQTRAKSSFLGIGELVQPKASFPTELLKNQGLHPGSLPPESSPQAQIIQVQSPGKLVKSGNDKRDSHSIRVGKHLAPAPKGDTGKEQITEGFVRIPLNCDSQPSVPSQDFGSPQRDTSQGKRNRDGLLKIEKLRRRREALAVQVQNSREESDSDSVEDIVFQFTSSETQAVGESTSPESVIITQKKRGRKTNVPRRRKVVTDLEVETVPHDQAHHGVEEAFSNNKAIALDTRSSFCFDSQGSRSGGLIRKRKILESAVNEVDEGKSEDKDNGSNEGTEYNGQRPPVGRNPTLQSKQGPDYRIARSVNGIRKRQRLCPDLKSSRGGDDTKGSALQTSTQKPSNEAGVVSDNQHSTGTDAEREEQATISGELVTGGKPNRNGNAIVLGLLSQIAEGNTSESDGETDSIELIPA